MLDEFNHRWNGQPESLGKEHRPATEHDVAVTGSEDELAIQHPMLAEFCARREHAEVEAVASDSDVSMQDVTPDKENQPTSGTKELLALQEHDRRELLAYARDNTRMHKEMERMAQKDMEDLIACISDYKEKKRQKEKAQQVPKEVDDDSHRALSSRHRNHEPADLINPKTPLGRAFGSLHKATDDSGLRVEQLTQLGRGGFVDG
ncbi:hypothetical protein DXG03_009612 [Asterophora parasitica]|uniref:Uncharacterized protein n=1 Tax=Asterophora parasitica TaxID=117018 RepID=A0A9P7K9W6_9AGAR|nr:hypothetical protein DXG03_009612 [Asterophora parasitica]